MGRRQPLCMDEVRPVALDRRVTQLAASQAGAFSLTQARALGFKDHLIRYRIATGRWLKPLPRTFVLAGSLDTPSQRMTLAYLWGGEGSVVCRDTAAWVWGLAPDKGVIDLAMASHRQPPASWIVVHRHLLQPCDVVNFGAIETTNATRTLIDLAGDLDERALELMLDEALRRGLSSIPRMRWRLEQIGAGRSGCPTLRKLLHHRLPGGPSESVLETIMASVFKQMLKRGFPTPQRQFPVRLTGCRNARLDLAFPRFRVGLEGDGRRWHGPVQWQEDLRRENAFRQAGWDVRRFSWRDATKDPAYLLDQAEAALRLAGWKPYLQGTL